MTTPTKLQDLVKEKLQLIQSEEDFTLRILRAGATVWEWKRARTTLERVVLVGAGEGVAEVGLAIVDVLRPLNCKISGYLNTPKLEETSSLVSMPDGVEMASFDLGDEAACAQTNKAVILLEDSASEQNTLILFLLGNKSDFLFALPTEPIQPAHWNKAAFVMIQANVKREQWMAVMKHMDALKGGQLARVMWRHGLGRGARLVQFVIAEREADMHLVGSGPFFPDDTSFFQAVVACQVLRIDSKIPSPVWWHFTAGLKKKTEDTPKGGEPGTEDQAMFDRIHSEWLPSQ